MPITFKLKVLLAVRGMTQRHLAEITGIRPPTISAICNGTIKELPTGVIERICSALSCQPGDIMEYVDD